MVDINSYISSTLRYYFGSTGKAYRKSNSKTINGKKYGFDEDGKMLFGYVEENSYNIINDEDDPILNAAYYYGTNEDGARHTGWLKYTDSLADRDKEYYWFYFNTSNGKKVAGEQKTINGKKYKFDSEGVMQYEWVATSTASGLGTMSWFNSLEDGSLAKNKWIWNKPYESNNYLEDGTQKDYDDETNRWFRTDASGQLIKGKTKKINSKWYVFDKDGVMRTGLVVLSDAEGAVSGSEFVEAYDMDTITSKQIRETYAPGVKLHYFSEDEEKDGSMKTGTMKIELADDEKTFCFNKTTGAAKDGYDKSSKKVYNSGILEKAGDDKYKVVTDLAHDQDYLVGSTGSIVKSVNKYKDANDQYYVYLKKGDDNWYIGVTGNEDDAKAVVNKKDAYTVDEDAKTITVTDDKGKTHTIKLAGEG